jgi:mannan endo-1,4-beta-mannosidase
MDTSKQLGANVIRSWAFLDVSDRQPGQVAFQYFDSGAITVDEGRDGLERLDALIETAEEMGVRLILPVVNYWPAFGGMPLYLKWLGITGDVSEFYSSPAACAAYRNWVEHVLTRRNTRTGRRYNEEPAIMAWELTNEARCPIQNGRELLLDWVEEMSRFVKRLDSNHLLALGDEGFFKGDGHGTDFEALLAMDAIDFGSYHFYPQDWGYARDLRFAEKWIQRHAKAGERAGKPVLLEEYGLRIDGITVANAAARDEWYAKWLRSIEHTGTAGHLLWMIGGTEKDTAGYRDDFVVIDPGELTVFSSHARRMA